MRAKQEVDKVVALKITKTKTVFREECFLLKAPASAAWGHCPRSAADYKNLRTTDEALLHSMGYS